MATCLDRLLKKIGGPFPEIIVCKMTVSVSLLQCVCAEDVREGGGREGVEEGRREGGEEGGREWRREGGKEGRREGGEEGERVCV